MSLYLKIADIPISVQGSCLSSIITPAEKRLLRPFTVKPQKNCFTVTLSLRGAKRRSNLNDRLGTGCAISKTGLLRGVYTERSECARNDNYCVSISAILEKIKKDFPEKISQSAKTKTLDFFKDKWLKYADSDIDASSRIIMTDYSFFIFNEKLKRCDILFKKSGLSSRKKSLPGYLHFLSTLKMLFRLILSPGNKGIVLHASSACHKGYSYIFMGPSGFGKSTVIKMLGMENSFSDDSSVIRKTGKGYFIYPVPFWNKESLQEIKSPQKSVRLKAIFLIERSDKTEISRIGYKEALAELLYSDSPFQQLRFLDSKSGIKGFYTFSENMLKHVPVFKLRIRKHEYFKNEFTRLIEDYALA